MELNNENKSFAELYSDSEYEKPSVTIDSVIFRLKNIASENYRKLPEKKLQVYLLKRTYPPFKSHYSIPGTFIDLNFELNQSIQLCLQKKVNLSNYYYEQLYTFGEKIRDPRARVLSCSYMILTNEDAHIQNGEWFSIDTKTLEESNQINPKGYTQSKTIELELKSATQTIKNKLKITITKENLKETKTCEIIETDIAFDHAKIIYFGLERLKNKLEYTDIIFNLLPEKFTLTELKMAYETILNEKMFDANFRRKTAKLVVPTNEFSTGNGFRNSQIFKHNPTWNYSDLD